MKRPFQTPAALSLAFVLAAAGCFSTPTGFDSPDPNERVRAIIATPKQTDAEAIPRLIDQLYSTDPAARMLAAEALRERTGETLGYHHGAPEAERHVAAERWRVWAAERGLALSSMDQTESGS